MAHFKIGVNTETGEVVLSASKKVKEALESAINLVETSGYDSCATNAVLAYLVPLNMSSSERSSEEVEGEDEDIILETTFEAPADIIKQALTDATIEIIGNEEDDDNLEDDDNQ